MWTNEKILKIAMEQSARDLCCEAEDFQKRENIFVLSRSSPDARKYLELPFSCQMVSYGSNVVASTSPELRQIAEKYLAHTDASHAFETPGIHILEDALSPHGQRICFMAEYFLPDLGRLTPFDCKYEMRILEKGSFTHLYTPEW